MLRFTLASFALLGAISGAPSQESPKPAPIAATRVLTTAAESTLGLATASLKKQSGIDFDLTGADASAKVEPIPATDFWLAVESLAKQTGSRISPIAGKVRFAKGASGPSSVDGPFRVSVKQVIAKRDFDTDTTAYAISLEVMWEPRFPVYMIDDVPKIDTVTAGGKPVKALTGGGRVPTVGFRQLSTVRLEGIPRSAATLDVLRGSFRVVAAEKLLAVEFKDLTAVKPLSQTTDGVTLTLQPVKRSGKLTIFDINMEYPPSHPEFESFELWASANKLKLYPPNAAKGFEPTDYSTHEAGRRIAASYSYEAPAGKPAPLADLKGWRAVYETSGPMVTQTVKFELKGIALP